MCKLLRANAKRVLISKLFWGETIIWLLYCLAYQADSCRRAMEYGIPSSEIFQQTLFSFTTFMGVLYAVFVSILIGTEYSDGTIRNKLIIGRSRTSIYLSDFIACAAAGIIQTAAASFTFLVSGVLILGETGLSAVQLLQTAAVMFFLCISYAAVYAFISMLSGSRANGSVVNLLTAFGLLFAGAYLSSRLSAPETITEYRMAQGAIQAGEQIPNPGYLSGMKRTVYQFLLDFLPGGQNMELAQGSLLPRVLEHPGLLCFYSAVLAAVLTLAGLLLFNRKDMK